MAFELISKWEIIFLLFLVTIDGTLIPNNSYFHYSKDNTKKHHETPTTKGDDNDNTIPLESGARFRDDKKEIYILKNQRIAVIIQTNCNIRLVTLYDVKIQNREKYSEVLNYKFLESESYIYSPSSQYYSTYNIEMKENETIIYNKLKESKEKLFIDMNLLRIGSVEKLLSGNIIVYQINNTIECIFDKNEKIEGVKYENINLPIPKPVDRASSTSTPLESGAVLGTDLYSIYILKSNMVYFHIVNSLGEKINVVICYSVELRENTTYTEIINPVFDESKSYLYGSNTEASAVIGSDIDVNETILLSEVLKDNIDVYNMAINMKNEADKLILSNAKAFQKIDVNNPDKIICHFSCDTMLLEGVVYNSNVLPGTIPSAPKPVPQHGNALKSNEGAYFSKFPIKYGNTGYIKCPLWLIDNYIIMKIDLFQLNLVDFKFKNILIVYFNVEREINGSKTLLLNRVFNIDKTYGYTNDQNTIDEINRNFGYNITTGTSIPFEQWYEIGIVLGSLINQWKILIEKALLFLNELYTLNENVYITGMRITGSMYTEKTIPKENYQPPVVSKKSQLHTNVYFKNLYLYEVSESTPTDAYINNTDNNNSRSLFEVPEVAELYSAQLWIFQYNMIMRIELNELKKDNNYKLTMICDYSIERQNQDDFTEIKDIKLSRKRSYAFTDDVNTINLLKKLYNITIELGEIKALDDWIGLNPIVDYDIAKYEYLFTYQIQMIKKIYERNSKIYIEEIGIVGEEYRSSSLPSNFGPTYSPLDDNGGKESYIFITIVSIVIVIFTIM